MSFLIHKRKRRCRKPLQSRSIFLFHIMNILKINKGKVEIRKDNGTLIRTIGTGDAITADFNNTQTLVVITTIKGKVEIRKENGTLVRTIGTGDATGARWNGSDIAITTSKGKTELRKENGTLIRTI